MAFSQMQTGFVAGEVSPALWGHADLAKYRLACSTMRNCFANIRGGVYSRGGTKFCGQAKQQAYLGSVPPRIGTFQFKVGQAYVLEFGDGYIRFVQDGAYITEAPIPITAASQGNPCTLTVPAHGYSNGDWVAAADIAGMTELNNQTFIVANVTTNTFTLQDTFGNPVNSLGFDAYTSGGTVARIYTLAAPYAAADLTYLKYAQSADVMTLVLSNQETGNEYAPEDLQRMAANNWSLGVNDFATSIDAPASCSVAASNTTSSNQTQYQFVVTAIDEETGQESVASPIGTVSNSVDIALTAGSLTVTWGAVTGAGSYNVYKAPAAYNSTVPVGSMFGYVGTAFGTQFLDDNIVPDYSKTPPLHLNPFARSALLSATLVSGGSGYTQATTTATLMRGGSAVSGVALTPVVVGGAVVSIIVVNGGENLLATDTIAIADSGGGTGAAFTPVLGPASGTYPGVVAYFQQRRVYADTFNNPDTYMMSQPGAFRNFDAADPPIDSDSVIGTPWAQQINGIQWLNPMPGGLIVATGLDAWQLSGNAGPATPVTPSSQNATAQESQGFSPTVGPIKIGSHLIYLQSLGTVVRDLIYNFYTNTYAGEDLSQLANHLFDGYQIVQWAWSREPYKILWAVRDDGVLVSMTYLKEQEVIAWARHDTLGQVVGVTVASEPPVDAVYIVVKRYIPGKAAYAYYVERMDDRVWQNINQVWAVDAGLTLERATPAATIQAAAKSGTGVSFKASAAVFDGTSVGVIGQIIRAGGGKASVVSYVSPTEVTADITVDITALTPNDPDQMPLPQPPGAWSIATPVSTISGLNHLEGMTVTGLADGAVIPGRVVTNGAITLPFAASAVTVGLGFQAQVQTLPLQLLGGPNVQGKRKLVTTVTARVERSRGVKLGSDQPVASAQENNANVPWGVYPYGKMIEIPEQQNQINAGEALPLFTGDRLVNIDGDWNLIGWSAAPAMVAAQQDYPLPMQISAFIPEFVVGDS